MTEEERNESCPQCGEEENWYQNGITGPFDPNTQKYPIIIVDGGHCLKCGYDSDRIADERRLARRL